ncbi:MAG: GNAT family N-acetyltransferase [Methylomonas sp.]|jgi:ribosomal protein S18 acetylase RimI-like enzyme
MALNIKTHKQIYSGLSICKPNIKDINKILNLVIECAEHGHFTDQFLNIRFQAGLGIQFFKILFFNRLTFPGEATNKAVIYVAKHKNAIMGFCLIREIPCPGAPAQQELLLLCVDEHYRRRGIGQSLLEKAISICDLRQALFVSCLPKSQAMLKLLKKIGAIKLAKPDPKTINFVAPECFVIGNRSNIAAMPSVWPYVYYSWGE